MFIHYIMLRSTFLNKDQINPTLSWYPHASMQFPPSFYNISKLFQKSKYAAGVQMWLLDPHIQEWKCLIFVHNEKKGQAFETKCNKLLRI